VAVTLSTQDLERISGASEVVIETRSGDRIFGTVIWVAIDQGDVFVRSVRGHAGRWFQRALADPEVTLRVGDTRFRFLAESAADDESVQRTSDGLSAKYPKGRSLDAMLRPEVLDTTLLLQPRP
jgi:hypothetical protein